MNLFPKATGNKTRMRQTHRRAGEVEEFHLPRFALQCGNRGGDAQALFANDELIENIVPELQLIGIAAACHRVLADEDETIGHGKVDEDDLAD